MLKIFLFIVLSGVLHGVFFSISYRPVLFINESGKQGSSSLVIDLVDRQKKKMSSVVAKEYDIRDKKSAIKKIVSNNKKQMSDELKAYKSKPMIVNNNPKDVMKSSSLNLSDGPNINETKVKLIKQNKVRPKNDAEQNKKIRGLLNNEISKYFYYPKSAYRKNHQGEVVLMFSIESTGLINDVQIKMSSGYRILDEAAIKALKNIKINSLLAEATNGQRYFQYTLPVVYRIE